MAKNYEVDVASNVLIEPLATTQKTPVHLHDSNGYIGKPKASSLSATSYAQSNGHAPTALNTKAPFRVKSCGHAANGTIPSHINNNGNVSTPNGGCLPSKAATKRNKKLSPKSPPNLFTPSNLVDDEQQLSTLFAKLNILNPEETVKTTSIVEHEVSYRNFKPDKLSQIDYVVDQQQSAVDGPSKIGNEVPITVPQQFREIVKLYGNECAYKFKRDMKVSTAKDSSIPKSELLSNGWESVTYNEYHDSVTRTARAFISLGLEKFHAVAIIGFNAPEWFISNFAAIFAGGLSTGIYTTNSSEACLAIMQDCTADLCIVEDGNQMKKILAIADKLPNLKAIIQYKEHKNFPADPTNLLKNKAIKILKWSELSSYVEATPLAALEERISAMKPNNCCTLIYTSGTTGNSKGVMISHDNLVWTANNLGRFLHCQPRLERIVSYLPLSHIAAQMVDMYMILFCGSTIWFAQPDALKGSLVPTLKEAKPTIFYGVPRVWEKIADKIGASTRTVGGIKRHITEWAKSIGKRSGEALMKGESTPWGHMLADRLVFSKIKTALGLDACRYFVSTGAPCSLHTLRYFEALGIRIQEVYGASECSGPATVNYPDPPGFCWIGSCGPLLPGTQIKIDDHHHLTEKGCGGNGCNSKILPPVAEDQMGGDVDHTTKDSDENTLNGDSLENSKSDACEEGEICIKGRHVFMGYLNMESLTNEAIDADGYFHTGDMGKLVSTVTGGPFLFITGRLKELIITAGGENIAPVPIENAIKEELCPIVNNVMVVGDYRKFLSVLITLKTDLCESTGTPTDHITAPAQAFILSNLLSSSSPTLSPQKFLPNGSFNTSRDILNIKSNHSLGVNTTASKVDEGSSGSDIDTSSVKSLITNMPSALKRYINDGIDMANVKAVSRAAFVRKWVILEHDFSIAGGELGPTMKLRRPLILKKYAQTIESLYAQVDGQNDESSVDTKQS